jgi:capsular polysaccharide biosynthesis protein
VLTTSGQPDYVKQGLDLTEVQVEYVDKIWIEVDRLWIVDKAFFGLMHTEDVYNVRTFCKGLVEKSEFTTTSTPKVYVSRRGFARSMANEAELEDWLESIGFTIFRVSEMADLRQQARLFSSAKVLIGSTGSSFSNVVFMDPGSQAIELSVALQNWPECKSLCLSAGISHHKILLNASMRTPYGDGKEAIQKLKDVFDSKAVY